MFMVMCTLSGFWLWKTRAMKELWGFPVGLLVLGLWGTTILCKVLGAILLLHLGIVVICSPKLLRSSVVVLLLIAAPILYMAVRGGGSFTGDAAISVIRLLNETRADSLQFRLDAENEILRNTMDKPIFGYGSDPQWRARLADDPNAKAVVTDGMWIIALGQGGLFALLALTTALLVPPFLIWRRMPVAFWEHPAFAPVVGLAVMLVCFMIDSLFNATINMISLLIAGAVNSMVPLLRSSGAAQSQPAYSRTRVNARQVQQQTRQPARRPAAYAS
jgi:hypothetical protein